MIAHDDHDDGYYHDYEGDLQCIGTRDNLMILVIILPKEDFQTGEREALAVCLRCFGRLGHAPGHDDDDDADYGDD